MEISGNAAAAKGPAETFTGDDRPGPGLDERADVHGQRDLRLY
jgi:hypothetical protein